MTTWTDDQIDALSKLWDQGLSAREIGKQLGFSRNAVCGKVHRLGLYRDAAAVRQMRSSATPRKPVAPRMTRPKAIPRPPRARPQVQAAAVVRRANLPKGAAYAKVTAALADASLAKHWMERRFGECAYPISGEGADTFSCCQPTEGATYCAGHRARMFAKPSTEAQRRAAANARAAKARRKAA